ncbi:hypothetical protein F5B19DRAFT_305111 [Rostrohypoxylon terebratum]|nr:hypothetical protein F5B19DRAFT_305111 [Rostrohypoxylon terebratum]
MPPRRKEPSPTDASSGSDEESKVNFKFKPSATIPKAMESIDKWKSKRTGIRKNIDKDYTNKLASLKNEIKEHYEQEALKRSGHNKKQLERLLAAVEKRISCEEKITKEIDSLREDTAHIAMLIDAIYSGREEAAQTSAKKLKPSQSKE